MYYLRGEINVYIAVSLRKIWKRSQHTDFNEDILMKALMWPIATWTYGCERWTLRKNEETRLERKGLINILRVSWTANKTNQWVLNLAGVKRKLLDTVKAKLA